MRGFRHGGSTWATENGRKPARIKADTPGPGLSSAPLTLTADHALLFNDMLINAGTLTCRFHASTYPA